METREEYTTTSPDQFAKLLWLPNELHEWFRSEAKRQDRSVNAEMIRALKAYKMAREISENA
jgi:hypothetical protein